MIRILLADDAGLMLDAMRRLLEEQPEIYVVGGAATAAELHYLLPNADILLIGPVLEGQSILELMPEIQERTPAVKVVVVGLPDEPDLIMRYVEGGVAGYVLRQESIDNLVSKVRAAYDNKALVSPAMTAQFMGRLAELANQVTPLAEMSSKMDQIADLTPRETEVLSLVSLGDTNRAIALKLGISLGTVKNHVHKILKKLGVKTRQEAALVYENYQGAHGILTSTPPGPAVVSDAAEG